MADGGVPTAQGDKGPVSTFTGGPLIGAVTILPGTTYTFPIDFTKVTVDTGFINGNPGNFVADHYGVTNPK